MINMVQRSKEWHDFRKTSIGGSEINKLFNIHKNNYDKINLLQHKLNRYHD